MRCEVNCVFFLLVIISVVDLDIVASIVGRVIEEAFHMSK